MKTHPGLTLEELSGRTGASLHALRDWCSLGLLGAKPEESFSPEEALFQVVRVYVDARGRVAEAEAHLFHFYVHERLKDAGLSGPEVVAATEVASGRMRALIEPAVLYFHRRGMARALREDMLLHLADYAGTVDRS